ncbi:hypothetical protein [Luteimicrobium sp. DT211]
MSMSPSGMSREIVLIGSGSAGHTAAVHAARAPAEEIDTVLEEARA